VACIVTVLFRMRGVDALTGIWVATSMSSTVMVELTPNTFIIALCRLSFKAAFLQVASRAHNKYIKKLMVASLYLPKYITNPFVFILLVYLNNVTSIVRRQCAIQYHVFYELNV